MRHQGGLVSRVKRAAIVAAVLLSLAGCQPGPLATEVAGSPLATAIQITAPAEARPADVIPTPPRPLFTVVAVLTPEVQEVPVETKPAVPAPASSGLQALVAQAKEDLARRLAVELDQIALVEVTPVVWPDGSLGCPQPGMAYIQVQVEGVLIRLRVGKQIYPYHGGGGAPPALCEQAITKDGS